MKKIFALLAALAIPVLMSAQAQITTKKVKIEDFTEKTLKVVLSGNTFFDSALKSDMKSVWTISPYEFCSLEEFSALKTDPGYYFLIKVKGQFRKESEPGIEFLSIMKGDPDAGNGMDKMLDLVTFPYCAADSPSGRESVYLPAILEIMQNHILASQETDLIAYGQLGVYSNNLSKVKDATVLMAEEDLSAEITPVVKRLYFKNGIEMTDADTADECMMDASPDTVVSYTVCPGNPVPGSFCYKVLIDTGNNTLCYFRKHRITRKLGPGFLLEDIKRIAEAKN